MIEFIFELIHSIVSVYPSLLDCGFQDQFFQFHPVVLPRSETINSCTEQFMSLSFVSVYWILSDLTWLLINNMFLSNWARDSLQLNIFPVEISDLCRYVLAISWISEGLCLCIELGEEIAKDSWWVFLTGSNSDHMPIWGWIALK